MESTDIGQVLAALTRYSDSLQTKRTVFGNIEVSLNLKAIESTTDKSVLSLAANVVRLAERLKKAGVEA